MDGNGTHGDTGAELYIDLLTRALTGSLLSAEYRHVQSVRAWKRVAYRALAGVAHAGGLEVVRVAPPDPEMRAEGRDWPPPGQADSMIGLKRMDNVRRCVTDVLRSNVPGDLIETGVWRGGTTILMRGILKAYGDRERRVWVADSFQGLPKPDADAYPADAGDRLWTYRSLAVSLDDVRDNFARYGLLDDQVVFLPGWFKETLPTAPIEQLAVLRLDGDLYESTMVALENLYPRLAVGGYVIVDDYGGIAACRRAVDDYRRAHDITEPIGVIDWTGIFWQRLR